MAVIEKSYNVTVGEVLHNLRVLCDGYESVIAGKNFQCRAADAAVTVKGAAALISQLPCWIPVAERLPEAGVAVLVWLRGEVEIAWLNYSANAVAYFNSPTEYSAQPSHWMPLPPPPGGGSRERDARHHRHYQRDAELDSGGGATA